MHATPVGRRSPEALTDSEWAVTDTSLVMGIAWYRPEQWTRLRDLASDRDKLEGSYEDWPAGAQKTLVQMAVTGVRTQRVDIDIDALASWCQAEGRTLDSAARAEYAALQLRRTHQGGDSEHTV